MTKAVVEKESGSSVRRAGVGMALGAAVLFGVSAPLAKLLLGAATPQLLAGLLYLGSGVGLGIVWLRRRDARKEAKLTRRDVPARAVLLATGGAAALWERTTNPPGAVGDGIGMA